MLRIGEVFAGYVIEGQLGSGGMGEMFLARHPRLPRLIAIKLLRREFATDDEIRARFEREADLIARLDHPNIVSVYDRGVDDGRLWIAMQYVDGADVSTLDPSILPAERAVEIAAETAKALDYAHAVGVVHRDVKPANIMLARPSPGHGERILLTDFGIGRLRDDTKHLTRTGSLTATLAYASPEQLSGAGLDHRSDQYSLACTLFWLLCGSTPFESDNVAAVVAGHLHYPPPPVSARRPGLPPALDEVLARALAKRPEERFGSCVDFTTAAMRALTSNDATLVGPSWRDPNVMDTAPSAVVEPPGEETFRSESPPPAFTEPPRTVASPAVSPPSGTVAPPAVSPPGTGAPPAVSPSSQRRTGRWAMAGTLGLVALLAVVVGIVWANRDSSKDSASSSGGSAEAGSAGAGDATALIANVQPLGQIDEQGNQVTPATPAADPAGDGSATCSPATIAMAGALTGDNATLGGNVLGGVRLAVAQFNQKNPECRVTVKEFDTTGSAQVATRVAPEVVNDASVVALIGPVFSGETKATGQIYSDAGLPFLTPAATNPTLSDSGWHTFFRGVASDSFQGPAVGRHLAAGYGRVCVVQDNSDYGTELARGITSGLGSAAVADCAATIKPGDDLTALVSRISTAAPDAVFYAGYNAEAAPLLQRLREAGITATFVSGDGSYDAEFVSSAGSAATGTLLSCPCGAATATFLSDYELANGGAAGIYSVEAYDLATIVLHGIASGHTTRADLLTYLQSYDGIGLAHSYRWTSTGELAEPRIWMYQVG